MEGVVNRVGGARRAGAVEQTAAAVEQQRDCRWLAVEVDRRQLAGNQVTDTLIEQQRVLPAKFLVDLQNVSMRPIFEAIPVARSLGAVLLQEPAPGEHPVTI